VRLFLAGVVPDAVKQTLHAQLASVRVATPQARWLPADSLHLTLVFLGAVPDPSVLPLQAAFGSVCGRHHPVHLTLGGVETFGPSRSPRVLATTLAGDVEELHSLVADARHAAEPLVPLETERQFRPHLTVARARSPHGDVLLSINGEQVNTATGLTDVLDRHYPGDVVDLVWVDRNGHQLTGKATLSSGD